MMVLLVVLVILEKTAMNTRSFPFSDSFDSISNVVAELHGAVISMAVF